MPQVDLPPPQPEKGETPQTWSIRIVCLIVTKVTERCRNIKDECITSSKLQQSRQRAQSILSSYHALDTFSVTFSKMDYTCFILSIFEVVQVRKHRSQESKMQDLTLPTKEEWLVKLVDFAEMDKLISY